MTAAENLQPKQFGVQAHRHPTEESVRHIVNNYSFVDDPASNHDAEKGVSRTGPEAWKRVADNYVADTGVHRRMSADIAQHGVKEPIRIDYHQTPPQVTDGHTRLWHANRLGIDRVPVKQGEFSDVHMPTGEAEPTECQ